VIALGLVLVPLLLYAFGKYVERKFTGQRTAKVTPLNNDIPNSSAATARNVDPDQTMQKLFEHIGNREY